VRHTEPIYLKEVRARLNLKATSVVVYHGRHTDPEGIVREAIKLSGDQRVKAAKSMTEPYDQVWVVFDREGLNHPRRDQVPAAMDLAERNGVKVALSIPSFEFWLLLHYEFTTRSFDDCSAVQKALKKFIKDYDKSELPVEDLLNRVKTAMKHAAQCHKHWDEAGGHRNPSTAVDKLLRTLNLAARSGERLF
jgi:hypothetical protein